MKISEALIQKAKRTLEANRRGHFTLPSKHLYAAQWNWDAVFIAMGYATYNEAQAWLELESLFKAQWENGMLPHIVFHESAEQYYPNAQDWNVPVAYSHSKLPCSGITQPPVAAYGLELVLGVVGNTAEAAAHGAALYPKVMAWHKWFYEYRQYKNSGFVFITHPWESGRDNSVLWDKALRRVQITGRYHKKRKDTSQINPDHRPLNAIYDIYMSLVEEQKTLGYKATLIAERSSFKVVDMGFNAILARSNWSLLSLARRFGNKDDVRQIEGWIAAFKTGSKLFYDEKKQLYVSYDMISGSHIGHEDIGSYMLIFAGTLEPAELQNTFSRMEKLLHTFSYGMPSLHPEDPNFEAKRYWRGSSWLHINWLLMQGFYYYNKEALAQQLSQTCIRLAEKSGYYEYYDPYTAEGIGASHFSWPAAIILLLEKKVRMVLS